MDNFNEDNDFHPDLNGEVIILLSNIMVMLLTSLVVKILVAKMNAWKIAFILVFFLTCLIVAIIKMSVIGLKYKLKYEKDDTFTPTAKDKFMMMVSRKDSSYNLNVLMYDALKDNDIKLIEKIISNPNFNPKIKVKTPDGYLNCIDMMFRKHAPSNREIMVHMMRDYRFDISLQDILCEMYHLQNVETQLFALDVLKLYIFFRTDKKEDIEASFNDFHWIECSKKEDYQMMMNMMKNDYESAYTHIKNELGYTKNMNFMMKLIDQGDIEALKTYVNKKKNDAMIKRRQAPQEPQQTTPTETTIQTNI